MNSLDTPDQGTDFASGLHPDVALGLRSARQFALEARSLCDQLPASNDPTAEKLRQAVANCLDRIELTEFELRN